MSTALDIANWFLASIDREAGDSITPLKLQKLVYYAQAWSLALRGESLFEEDFQAWAHGPVVESVYQAYRSHGWNSLPAPDNAPELEPAVEDFLMEILEVYGGFSAKHLELMTHGEQPWMDARAGLPPEARSNAILKKADLINYYRAKYESMSEQES